MSIIDQQICKALDRIHVELAGLRAHCRWQYDAKQDAYYCQHTSVPGKEVIKEVNPYFLEG